MMINGERIPAPEGDARQVALDAVPADQLQSIEVSKAVTPDMDADSIGGAVNLLTKQAVSRPTVLFSAGGGYNALQRSGDQQMASGTVGRRFANGKAGLLAGFSASRLFRGSENFEADYAGNALADFQLRDYQIDRNRYGFNASGDVRLSAGSSLVVRSLVNRFEDYEVNNRIRFRPANRRIEHVLKNRNQNQNIRSLSVGATHALASGTPTPLPKRSSRIGSTRSSGRPASRSRRTLGTLPTSSPTHPRITRPWHDSTRGRPRSSTPRTAIGRAPSTCGCRWGRLPTAPDS
jgi:hypothetical protein